MPRGHCKESRVLAGTLGRGAPMPGAWAQGTGGGGPSQENRAAIERSVTAFAKAWFEGDSTAMLRSLHPDYVSRLVGIDGAGEPRATAQPAELLRKALGLQSHFGALTAPERRQLEVRVLDVRLHSASAVAALGEWVLQAHLARTGRCWSIVNVMWEML